MLHYIRNTDRECKCRFRGVIGILHTEQRVSSVFVYIRRPCMETIAVLLPFLSGMQKFGKIRILFRENTDRVFMRLEALYVRMYSLCSTCKCSICANAYVV